MERLKIGHALGKDAENATYLGPILPLDDELVLQHDKVTLALLVLHQSLELGTECIEQVAGARYNRFGREEADPT